MDNFEHALERENALLRAEVSQLNDLVRRGIDDEAALRAEVERLTHDRDAWKAANDLSAKRWGQAEAEVERLTRERDEAIGEARDFQHAFDEARTELARIRALPDLEWAQASSVIAQGLALHARQDQPAAKRMLEVLDQAKTYVGRLVRDLDEARANESAATAHVTFVEAQWSSRMAGVEARAEKAEAECLRLQEYDRDVRLTQLRAAEERVEVAEADNAAMFGALSACSPWMPRDAVGRHVVDECVSRSHPGAALLERLRAAEKVVATARYVLVPQPSVDTQIEHLRAIQDALAAYDALKEGK